MIITSDCQKYHATSLKIFHRLVLVLERYSISVADHDQDRRAESGERRMKDGGWRIEVLECWSVGGLKRWSVGVLECWSVGFGAKQIGYAYWLRAN
jgi:hypothetical protein